MNLATKTMDLLFRRILPEQVLEAMLHPTPNRTFSDYERRLFLLNAESTLGGYSYDEQEQIYQYAAQRMDAVHQEHGIYIGREVPPFGLLVDYCMDKLYLSKTGPQCRFENVLEWREGYLLLGQDLLITAFLAVPSKKQQKIPTFSWPAVILSDSDLINSITEQTAENHLHLYAGASTFPITWCSVMNHPQTILGMNDQAISRLSSNLQSYGSRGTSGNVWSIQRRVVYAAYIRTLLFLDLQGTLGSMEAAFRRFHQGFGITDYECLKLRDKISDLRFLHGVPFYQPTTRKSVCLDYAFTNALIEDEDSNFRLLAGERRLMYRCFQKCFSGEFSDFEQQLFYLYLLLKGQFRSEFVQVNKQTGFHNFQDYDRRKYLLWKDNFPEYWNEDYRQSLNAAFSEQKLSSLEGRVSPQSSVMGNLRNVYLADQAKLYADAKTESERDQAKNWKPSIHMSNLAKEEPYFFVLHFAKKKDPDLTKKIGIRCRHEAYRRERKAEAIAVAKTLSKSRYFCDRVRGIDACSSEIGCRPEVLASAFRFLRSFPTDQYRIGATSQTKPRIAATYHVGEDFLDIADGLRAMDEAIWFLDLRRGDRFGHALALGINPKRHYQMKGGRIVLPKQDLLDNLVWLLYRSIKLNVQIPLNLKSSLTSRAEGLYQEIYGPYTQHEHRASLEEYYHSMLLRGDEPTCYQRAGDKVVFRDPCPSGPDQEAVFYRYEKNDRQALREQLRIYRQQSIMTELYYLYHYSNSVKQIGNQSDSMEITDEYIALIAHMQTAMQVYIDSLGISIECNPSSNVAIGTFTDYIEHPILSFNNSGLNLPEHTVQMHVSINSDDPGVFDTTLNFEYVLLAAALSAMKTDDGDRLISNREIEQYLRSIARMGREQSFAR